MTTFILSGEIFSRNPAFFYMFEPLFLVHFNQDENPKSVSSVGKNVQKYLNMLYNCEIKKFYQYSVNMFPSKKLQKDRKSWTEKPLFARKNFTSLKDIEFRCQQASKIAIKVIRIPRIHHLQNLVESLDIKVIYLMRDPRASLLSQITMTKRATTNARRWCQEMHENIRFLQHYCNTTKTKCRQHYRLVRYEDMALNPYKTTHELYEFLDLSPAKEVLTWIARNTNSSAGQGQPCSTARVSNDTVFAWRGRAKWGFVQEVQRDCGEVLRALGYNTLEEGSQLADPRYPVLQALGQ